MLPCAANPSPATPPAQGWQPEPVNVALRPSAATIPNWRDSNASAVARNSATQSSGDAPRRSISAARGPNGVFTYDRLAPAPPPATAVGACAPTARHLLAPRPPRPPVAGPPAH